MFYKFKNFLLLLGLLFICSVNAKPIALFKESLFYIDNTNALNSDTIKTLSPKKWKSPKEVSPLLVSKDVWIKTTLFNPSPKAISKIIYSSLTVSDAVDFYVVDQNGVLLSHSIAGDTRAYSKLTLKSRYPACKINLEPHTSLTLYTHINSVGRISLELNSASYEEFFDMENTESNIFGLFVGISFTIFVYYIALFIKARRNYMLHYGLYVLFVSAYGAGLFHLGHALIPDFLSLWYGMGFRIFLSLSYLFLGLFIYRFFSPLQQWIQNIFMGFTLLLSINILLLLYAFIWHPMLFTVLDLAVFPIYFLYVLLLFSYTLYLSFQKNFLAYYIAVGLGVLLITIISLGIAVLGLIKLPLLVQNFLFISSIVIDMICFVLAHQAQEEILKRKLLETQYIMFEQSKKSTIGAMLGNITHQWKQPLGQISSLIMSYDANRFLGKEANVEETDTLLKRIKNIITHMGETVGQFNTFFALEKESVSFNLQDAINTSLELVADTCKLQNVTIIQEKSLTPSILIGSRNGIVNILIIFLQNALENFKERALVKENKIFIRVEKTNNTLIIEISDNGGGVNGDIERIFEPYKSSKNQGSGTGLFMASWMMKERFNAKITATNTALGASFRLVFPEKNGFFGYSS